MSKAWEWLNGRKTLIAALIAVVILRLQDNGVEVPVWLQTINDVFLALGIAHKAAKSVPGATKALGSLVLVAVSLGACATSDQATPATQALGEGNKDMSIAMFDSVATTRRGAKLKDGEDSRGGTFAEPVTYIEVELVPYDVYRPILNEDGTPALDDSGDPRIETTVKYREIRTTRPVLGPDGKPIMRTASGFRNLVLNYGEIRQTQTSSGESSGTQAQDQRPTSSPTNTPSTPVNVSGVPALTGQ